MIRRLTREERDLWEKLRRSVRPLRPERKSAAADRQTGHAEAAPPQSSSSPVAARPRVKAAEPPLARLEERTRRRLARGLTEVDARIDLHGMRQERAYSALIAFLRHAQLRGSKLVLVITGKGRDGADRSGVLRLAVPSWLARPDFRELIVGFEEAGRRHGGAGALYVRLRRRNEARASPATVSSSGSARPGGRNG
jgi:DNA-nicking Smr family endonuclease